MSLSIPIRSRTFQFSANHWYQTGMSFVLTRKLQRSTLLKWFNTNIFSLSYDSMRQFLPGYACQRRMFLELELESTAEKNPPFARIGKKNRQNFVTIRAGSLYSTVDGSRQGVFWLVWEKKIKNKKCLPANVEGRKKIKGKFSEFYLFLGIFNKKKYILSVKIYVMSEEKIKKKAEWSVFFFMSGLILAHRRNRQP